MTFSITLITLHSIMTHVSQLRDRRELVEMTKCVK